MAGKQHLTVCRLVADDWETYRAIRLAMLADSPGAFFTTLAEAQESDEAQWRDRLQHNVVFLARLEGEPAGSAVYSERFVSDPDDADLVGMWVAPQARGTGAARALVQAVLDEAAAAGKRRVLLDVVETNARARRLYYSCGFVPTGVTTPYPHQEGVVELQLQHILPAAKS